MTAGKPLIMFFFQDGSDVEAYARMTSMLSGFIVLVQIPQLILNGILRGLGKNTLTLISSIVAILFVQVGLVYTFLYVFAFGLTGKWLATLVSQAVWCVSLSIFLAGVFRREDTKQK